MKKLVFMALILTTISISPAYAEPELLLNVDPEPLYDQMWAFETYIVNITLTGLNISEYSEYDLSGRVIADGIVRWRGAGHYKIGEGGAGYSYKLENITMTLNASIENPVFNFNFTLSRDAYLYGMWPFENVEIMLSVDVFLEEENVTGVEYGPQLGAVSFRYTLMDDDKVEYITGKIPGMVAEIQVATGTLGLPDFNRTKYESMVYAVNASISSGNYLEALDQWERWDEKDRSRMLNAFSSQVNSQVEELEALEGVETELERIQIEYDLIEDRYIALLSNNHRTVSELESTKQRLTTSITGIFLSAMMFYFLGRHSNKTGEE